MPIYTIKTPSGHELDINADSEADAVTGAEQWYQQNVTGKTDTSVTGALSKGASDLVSGVGKTIKEYVAPDAGKKVQDAATAIADPKYKSATEGFSHPEDGADKHLLGRDWSKLPRAVVEQAPGLAVDVATQVALKRLGPLAQILGGMTSFGLRTAGNEAQKRATTRTGDENTTPTFEDKVVGGGSTLAQAGLNQFGLSKITNPARVAETGLKGVAQAGGNVVKGALAEGATNAAQGAISDVAAGAPVDPHAALDNAILGTAGGGVFSGARGAKDAAAAVRFRGADYGEHTQMAANRVLDKVEKSSDLEHPETAYKAVSSAIADTNNELSAAAKTITNPSPETSNALKRAAAGEALSTKELAAIDAEGNESLSSLARQSSSLAQLTDKGSYDSSSERFAGGVGEKIRRLAKAHPFAAVGASVLPHIAQNGFTGLDSLAASVPGMLEAASVGVLGYKGLKAIEKGIGVQSPARTFAEKFGDGSGNVRPDVALNQSPTGPKVTPQNSLTPAQPWGPVADKPERFKPDIIDPGIAKIVEKIQNTKRRDTSREAMPLLRQLAEQNKPAIGAPGPDVSAMNEQVKSALLMASARRKIEGQRQAEEEAAASPMINEQGGLDAVRNPAMGKRANELISAAAALARLRRQPEEQEAPPTAPEPQPTAPSNYYDRLNADLARGSVSPFKVSDPARAKQFDGELLNEQRMRTPEDRRREWETLGFKTAPREQVQDTFTLPESPYWHLDPTEASHKILADAMSGPKDVRHPERYRASTERRLKGEEDIYSNISSALSSVKERGDFHKYLSALWGSDSPEVVSKVRDQMLTEFPQHAATINKHLNEEAIKGLWKAPKKKK
jgi:hypothetical protein